MVVGIRRREKQMVDLLQDYMDGILSQDEYYMIRQEYSGEIDALRKKEQNIRNKIERTEMSQGRKNELKAGLQRYREIKTLDRELAELLIREILVYKDGRIEIIFNFADEMGRMFGEEVDYAG